MNEKIKHKFNIIDLLIIALILAAVVSIVLRKDVTETISSAKNETKIEYSFILENIRESSCDMFAEGTEFLFQSNKNSAGKLLSYTVEPYKEFFTLSDGSIVKSDVPGKFNITGVLEATVRKTDDGYFFDDNIFIAPGSNYYVEFGVMHFMITVISVKEA